MMISGKTGDSRGRRTQALIACALLAVVAACSGGGGGSGDPVADGGTIPGDPPDPPDPGPPPAAGTWVVGPEIDYDPSELQQTYTLENPGPNAMEWNVQLTQSWLHRTGPASGTLDPGDSVDIVVDVDPYGADATGQAVPTGKVVFKNTATGDAVVENSIAVKPNFAMDATFAGGGTSNGWTIFHPSPDTRAIYVSSTQGNDANSGLSPSAPKKTIAAGSALLRHGFPDWMLLRRGDVWQESLGNWTKNGRSPSEPMVVGWYGAQAERPFLQTGNQGGLGGAPTSGTPNPLQNLAFVGLHFKAHTYNGMTDCTGVGFLQPSKHILIEDCMIEGYAGNVLFQGFGGRHEDLRLRRCVVIDAYDKLGIAGHPQGMFVWGVDGLLIEENIFDTNGWKPGLAGAEADIFSHNMYIDNGNTGVIVRGNIIANASSHGLQLRCGGQVINNLFVHNPIALQLGGGNHPEPSGIHVDVYGNVILDGSNIDNQPRGWGMTFANIANGRAAFNLVANNTEGGAPYPVQFQGNQVGDTVPSIGVHDLQIDHSVFYNWGGSIRIEGEPWQLSNIDLFALDLQDMVHNTAIVDHTTSGNVAAVDSGLNRFFLQNLSSSSWFMIAGSSHTMDFWKNQVGDTSSDDIKVNYFDPDVSVDAYHGLIGGAPSLASFLTEARKQSFKYWRPEYMAARVNRYARDGFRAGG